jgi:hypothetical protein
MRASQLAATAAGAIIAFEGLLLLVLAAATVAWALPEWLSANPIVVYMIGIPKALVGFAIGVFGLLVLLLALLLWRGRPGARVLAAALVAVAGLYSWTRSTHPRPKRAARHPTRPASRCT